ncbi:LysR family transcriptional regulator [Piscinibacter gummiphilus]|uniref:LysR family transcriptional regulator n=1 Tax=Piscinibacter gummiphilus TaxID=946333 RepID=A0A1W6LGH9_9BURK|nr:LysR family transcriptional regulator [Piscinibacter gummiphilus]ARN23384.1 LysR family transcriptional regulator [Piscinibacter gummiphilus]ATU68088.1 LysR family transcriptional regulator [Piscinibacter gummiphilus]GLS97393.1 transcriptional regulator [Piscinibacter gummiphilus]
MTASSPPLSSTIRTDAVASSFATSYAGVVAFMTVVAEGSFAKAGDRLGIGRSAVSRGVQKLETQLGTRLLSRTTRSLALTREGELFHARCHPGVAQITQALEDLRELRDGPPRGPLRISAPAGFGRKVVAPLLQGFHARYPDIALDLALSDAAVDFTSDRVDVAFRNGRLEDSQLIARQIVPMQMHVCAAPDYVKARGMPATPDDLVHHDCINYRMASGRARDWEFKVQGETRKVSPASRLTFNDAELVLQAVQRGQGIAQMPAYQISALLRSRALLSCMPQYAPDDSGHYICYLSRQHLPSRIRVFVDHMTTAIRALDLQCPAAL